MNYPIKIGSFSFTFFWLLGKSEQILFIDSIRRPNSIYLIMWMTPFNPHNLSYKLV